MVIAGYNHGPEVERQIGALLAPGDHPGRFEIVVADNGSADDTAARVRRLAASDDRVRYLDASARRGPGAARNQGVVAARGALIAFCDADDLVAPGWVAAIRAGLAEADLVSGWYVFEGHTTPQQYQDPFGYLPCGLGANLGIRAEVFDRVGGFAEELRVGEDVDLCWRAQQQGARFAHAPRAVVTKLGREDAAGRRRQFYGYGTGDPELYRRHRALGLRRNPRLTLKTYAWLLLNAPRAAVSPRTRAVWQGSASLRAGRLVGSWRSRSFFP